VPDVCLAAADNLYFVGALPGCSGITVLSNVSTTPVLIDFAPALPSNNVNSYVVIGGQFVGVNTGIIGGVDVGDVNYWFQFVATFTPGGIESRPSVHNLVNLFNNCGSSGEFFSCGDPIATATQGVTFTRVPEPASLALILGALGAGWVARKRKIAA
jgi:PEP-CTERM motif